MFGNAEEINFFMPHVWTIFLILTQKKDQIKRYKNAMKVITQHQTIIQRLHTRKSMRLH